MAKRKKTELVADEVLYVPPSVLVDSVPVVPNPARKKTAKKKVAKKRAPKKKPIRKPSSRFLIEEPIIEPFGGYEDFVVRTALVRSSDYNPRRAPTVENPKKAAKVCKHMAYYDQEHLAVLAFDLSARLVALYEAFIGGTAEVEAEIPHLIKVPLLAGAPLAVIVHNHPSGDPTPSEADSVMASRSYIAFKCVGIEMADSLVVATEGWHSVMAEGARRERW